MSRALVASLLILTGCTGMQRRAGFDDVLESVALRTGTRVVWNANTLEDQESQHAVRDLLQQELTADAAVQIALLSNRELQALYEELNIAQADLVQAGLLRNPILSGEVRWSTEGDGTGVALDVAQDFVSLLYLPLRKGRAGAAFEAAKIRVTSEVLDFAAEARTAFYETQAAEQLLEMRRSVVEATAASYDLAQRLREAGNNRDLDVANERAMHEESRLQLAAAEAMVIGQRERMNEIMGLWGADTTWHIASRLPAIPEQEIVSEGLEGRAIEASLDLALARRELEIAARDVGIAKPLGLLGDAEIGVAAEREVEGDWSVGPSLTLPVPLFDQGQAAVGSAQARWRQASERYAASAVQLRARVRAAYAAATEARDRAAHYQNVLLPLRQTIVDETQLQYNAMQVGAFELLQAKRDQIETGAKYIESLRDYWLARARLEQILSGRMTQSEPTGMSDSSSGARPAMRNGGH